MRTARLAAIDDSSFFTGNTTYALSNLHTWGWVTVILGVIQVVAGFSLMAGRTFGRMIGILAAGLGAIGALLSIGGAFPFWSLAIFALCVIVLHGIVVYGEDERV